MNLPLVVMSAALCHPPAAQCPPAVLCVPGWGAGAGPGSLPQHVWAAASFDLSWQQLLTVNTDGIYFCCPHSLQRAVQAFKFQLLVEFKHLNIILNYSCWSYTSIYEV